MPSSDPVAIAIDVGTTSTSAIAIDANRRVVATASRSHAAQVPNLPDGVAEQNPQRLRSAACSVLREIATAVGDRAACLGLTGQMHGVLLCNDQLQPVSNLITWQDRRALRPHPVSGKPLLEELHSRIAPEAEQGTGCRLSPGYLGTTLYALHETTGLPANTTRATLIIDWLAATFTGGPLVTDRSNAASTGLYDLQADSWSTQLLAAAHVPRRLLPDVHPGGGIIGRLTPDAAHETGLPPGLPVCNAIGDHQAAVLGSLAEHAHTVQVNIGTGGQICWAIDHFDRVDGLDTRYLTDNRYLLVGAGLAGGDAYAWVARTLQTWLRECGTDLDIEQVYIRLNRAVAAASPTGTLTCEPFFRGTRRTPDATGTFRGVTDDNFTPGSVGRAVLHGIARALCDCLELAGPLAPPSITTLIATGNAVRKNPFLVAALEDVFGLPVTTPDHVEEAAFGAALLAGQSTGIFHH